MLKKTGNVIFILMIVMVMMFVFFATVYAFPENARTCDVKGSSDHPLISRFPGSYIRYYDTKNYGEFTLPFGELEKVEGDKEVPQENKTIEGRVSKNFYVIPDGHSALEVFRNYELALKEAGFEILRKQEGNEGDLDSYLFYSKVNFDACEGCRLNGVGVNRDVNKQRYLAAKLERSQGDVYVSLYVARHGFDGGDWGDGRPAVYQVTVEKTQMKTGLIIAKSDYEESENEKKSDTPAFPENAETRDIKGSRDHPLISRFPGSYIRYYDTKNYGEFTLPFGELEKVEGDKEVPQENKTIEGRVSKNFYVIPDGHSALEVFRNYELALKEAGFEILRKQEGNEGDLDSYLFYSKVNFDACEGCRLNGVGVNRDVNKQRYLVAKLERSQGDVYVSLYVARHGFDGGDWGDGRPAVYQVIIEKTQMKTGLITAESIMQDIKSKGKVSIYGIYFDLDSAEIKAKSEPTVEKIAAVLKDNPDLKLYIVGHTDNTGEFSYNMDLSKRRAEAVVEKLVSEYNIKENRLIPSGVGPLAPAATNETEDGRTKNRRVELVKM